MDRNNGVFVGIVSSLKDPEGLGRVRVDIPHLADQQSYFARYVAVGNGKDRGFHVIPEIGDEVLVACELGDPRRLFVIGGLWNKKDTKPADDGKPEDNNHRLFRSRSGNMLRFDDTKGKEKIEIFDKTSELKLEIDISGKKIVITSAEGNVELNAPKGTVKVDAKSVEVTATADMKLQASGTVTIKGSTVNIN